MLRSGIVYLMGRFSVALITFAAIAVYTRLMSPQNYGVYALVQAGVAMAYAGLMQWLITAFARFMPRHQGREAIIRMHAGSAYLAVAAVVLLASPLVVFALSSDEVPRAAVATGVLLLLAMAFAELTLVQFNMLVQPARYTMFVLLRVLLATSIGVTLVYAGWGALGALTGLLLGHLAVIVPNLGRNWAPIRLGELDRQLLRNLATYGVPFAVTGVFAAVINFSDRYIIQILLSTDEAGLYAAPYDLAMRSLHVLMMIVAMAGSPLIFRTFESDGASAAAPLIRRQFELLLAATLPVALVFAMLAPAVVIVLGGDFRAEGARLLPWVAFATALHGFQSAYLSLAFALPQKPTRQAGIVALGALLNVGLNFYLIPRYGLVGAALATVAAYLLIVVLSFLTGRRLYPLPLPLAEGGRVLLALAIFGLVLYPVLNAPFSLAVVLHLLAAGVAYVCVLLALNVAGAREGIRRLVRRNR